MAKILIADDEQSMRLLVAATIESDEHEVLEASEGNQAWDMIVQHRPRVVILDVQMPGRDGLDLARAIRADPGLAGLRIIMLSGKALESNVQEGLAAGADVYLSKPFRPRDLRDALDRTLAAGA